MLAYLPSPPRGIWYLGPIPIRAYALCIIAGILVALWRWVARGGTADDVLDVATWAVPFGDAMAPGLVVAQAIGRWGNYFNQELYGGPSTLPWALEIDSAHRPPDTPDIGLYQPTFLYESLWDIGVAVLLVWAGRRFGLRDGRLFGLYVAAYTVGRAWVEALRIDHANHFLGLRLNDWTSLVVFLAAVGFLLLRRPRRKQPQTATAARQ